MCNDVKADTSTTRDTQQSVLTLGFSPVYAVMCFQLCPSYSGCKLHMLIDPWHVCAE